jgi:hypothetical protein
VKAFGMPKHSRRSEKPEIVRRALQRAFGSWRPPRVTDDGDDGLAGPVVPRMPKQPLLSGAAAIAVPVEEFNGP